LWLLPNAVEGAPADPTDGAVMEGVVDFDGYFLSMNPGLRTVLGWPVRPGIYACRGNGDAGPDPLSHL
jgi:hypothetical protein